MTPPRRLSLVLTVAVVLPVLVAAALPVLAADNTPVPAATTVVATPAVSATALAATPGLTSHSGCHSNALGCRRQPHHRPQRPR